MACAMAAQQMWLDDRVGTVSAASAAGELPVSCPPEPGMSSLSPFEAESCMLQSAPLLGLVDEYKVRGRTIEARSSCAVT